MKSGSQLLGSFFSNGTPAIFHFAEMTLRNPGHFGKLFLRKVFTTASPT